MYTLVECYTLASRSCEEILFNSKEQFKNNKMMMRRIGRGISFSRLISVQSIQSTKRMMSSSMDTCVAPYIQDGWDVRAFQKICGSQVDPISHTKQFLLRHPQATVHVGSDSKRRGSKIVYAVAIVLRKIITRKATEHTEYHHQSSVFSLFLRRRPTRRSNHRYS